ncbi:hypothetical protein V6N13_010146 [Hibiscus sabdariffa]
MQEYGYSHSLDLDFVILEVLNITLGPWHGSFSHGSPTPPTSLAGLQNYLRSCSEVILVVWLSPIERPRRSSRAFEAVKVVGWKRVYVGRRIVLRSGKFFLGAFTEKVGQHGFFFGSGQVGASNGTTRCYGGRSPLTRSPSLSLPHSNSCFEVVDYLMGFLLCVDFDDVFILGISVVKFSGEAVNLTVAVICVLIASPPVDIASAGVMAVSDVSLLDKVYIAGDTLRGNVQKPLMAFPSKQSISPWIGFSLLGILLLFGFVIFYLTLIPSIWLYL